MGTRGAALRRRLSSRFSASTAVDLGMGYSGVKGTPRKKFAADYAFLRTSPQAFNACGTSCPQ
jgi:hypothetical protein